MSYKKEYNEEELRPETTDEQKPTEWSKEDDAIHTRVLGALGKAFMGVLPTKPSQEDIEWFKSLPKRFNLRPKQEWSEEDEKQLNDIIRLLPGLDIRHSWLKSLKDKVLQSTSQWKPSEEQLETLKSYAEDSACLNELYEDLKKL